MRNCAASIFARIPAGRWGRPENFKAPVAFLVSGESGYLSGGVDGQMSKNKRRLNRKQAPGD